MSKIICYCKNISENEISEAINRGAKTLKDIQDMTGACTGNDCEKLNPSGKCCAGDISMILNTGKGSTGCSCCS
ncbi:MAG: hypothetical protein B6I20_10075 [Bacteroidetes bacterium 4572_117]|nr:MAG: hypothetical protein B6I20_10075 [Bacteroidetes bacterium 4572_117]